MSGDSKAGNIVGICFMVLWCTIAFGMGITSLQWGAPFLFVLAPFGMGIFGIVVCLAGFLTQRKKQQQEPEIGRYHSESIVYTGDYSLRTENQSQGRGRKSIYQIPSQCPSCGAAISTEEVDWVGPLQAKCPYCNATIDAAERTL
jgi:predicted Zn-ribbon and HTH transcriptional regulator